MIHPPQALRGASTLVLCALLCVPPDPVGAKIASQALPPVTIDAPVPRPAGRSAKKPQQRAASALRPNRPVVVVTPPANPPPARGDAPIGNAVPGAPPIK